MMTVLLAGSTDFGVQHVSDDSAQGSTGLGKYTLAIHAHVHTSNYAQNTCNMKLKTVLHSAE